MENTENTVKNISSQKSYYQTVEASLARALMSSWQRRGSRLLHVGLHSALSPDFFWDAGFDVLAIDENVDALNVFLQKTGPRIEYQVAKLDALPFDDDSFDYAFMSCYMVESEFPYIQERRQGPRANALISSLQNNPKALFTENHAFHEACRVAQKGVIILCKNAYSLYQFLPKTKKDTLFHGKALCPSWVMRQVKKIAPEADRKLRYSSRFQFCVQKLLHKQKYQKQQKYGVESSFIPFGDFFGVLITFNPFLVSGLGVLNKTAQKEFSSEVVINRSQ